MVDLHGLRGFHPNLAEIPCLLYFHENQFNYPQGAAKQEQIELQLVSVYSALCADQLVFNSLYNYKTFIAGLTKLLKKLPDFVPDKIVHEINLKSDIVPVPIPNESYQVGPLVERQGESVLTLSC